MPECGGINQPSSADWRIEENPISRVSRKCQKRVLAILAFPGRNSGPGRGKRTGPGNTGKDTLFCSFWDTLFSAFPLYLGISCPKGVLKSVQKRCHLSIILDSQYSFLETEKCPVSWHYNGLFYGTFEHFWPETRVLYKSTVKPGSFSPSLISVKTGFSGAQGLFLSGTRISRMP